MASPRSEIRFDFFLHLKWLYEDEIYTQWNSMLVVVASQIDILCSGSVRFGRGLSHICLNIHTFDHIFLG